MKTPKMPRADEVSRGRICWLCEHICFSQATPSYSEMTPGSDFDLACGKGYWEFDNYDDGLDEFRAKLESAEWCRDFSERKAGTTS